MRWSNEDELTNSDSDYKYQTIYPEELGVKNTFEFINRINPMIIIGSMGSAFYQLFINKKIRSNICIIFGGINSDDLWKDQFVDLKPFRKLFWSIYTETEITHPWNSSFNYDPNLIDKAIKTIKTYVSKNNNTIKLNSRTRLIPPRI